MKRKSTCKYTIPIMLLTLAMTAGCGSNSNSSGGAASVTAPSVTSGGQTSGTGSVNQSELSNASSPSSNNTSTGSLPSSTGSEKPAEQQIQTMLTDVSLLGDQLGYAWGVTAKELKMYRTEDAGVKWTAVSPPADGHSFEASPRDNSGIYVLDRDHMWVFQPGQNDGKSQMLRTKDGGKSWQTADLPNTVRAIGLYFINPNHGWLLSSSDAAMGKSEKSLYVTEDGGASWKQIMENTGYLPTDNPTPQAIPQSGYSRGMSFRDALNGFVPLETIDGKLQLYGTRDGGHSWSLVALQEIPGETNDINYAISAAPQFWGADRMKGWFPITVRGKDTQYFDGFFTTDGGQTWTFTPLNTVPVDLVSKSYDITFINDKEGWYLKDGGFSHTMDGGTTWKRIAEDPVLAGAFKTFPYAIRMEFTEKGTGWLLLRNEEATGSRLLQTKDGGSTWQLL
ncbi:hypothetical protein [Paenibacillus sp. 1_12]|uniref:WD40/YVTN/BNR-like repeat-containing protein n=1 Tax=Paenibacillus sp. 1_12 TaxID=1566278 RepID=UPI001160CF3E|nr:hypothetical protein [Paenibacillus sp. 1_12]